MESDDQISENQTMSQEPKEVRVATTIAVPNMAIDTAMISVPRPDLFRPYEVPSEASWSFLPSSFPNLGVQFPQHLTPNMPSISSYLPNLPANFPSISQHMPRMPTFNVPSMSVPSFSIPSMPSMPSLPGLMSTRPKKSWSELKESVRIAHRRLSEVSSKIPFAFNFTAIRMEKDSTKYEGVRLYFLCPSTNTTETTLHYCDVFDDDIAQQNVENEMQTDNDLPENEPVRSKFSKSSIEWKPLIESRFKSSAGTSINIEEKLQLERKRIMLTGITSYEMDPRSKRFVFSSGNYLFYFDEDPQGSETPHLPIKLESNLKSAKMNPQICPSNPDLIAFVSEDDLYVVNIKSGQEVRLTDSKRDLRKYLSMGIPSYVIQEEFNRYTGFWWRPEKDDSQKCSKSGAEEEKSNCVQYAILYEEVDETDVEIVRIPTYDAETEDYHFPRAGEQNATSSIRLVVFTYDKVTDSILETSNTFNHLSLPSLHSMSSDYEYLVRAGWWGHDVIWVQLLNRKQTRLVIGLISVSNQFPPQVLYEEIATSFWLNVSDVLHFVKQECSKNLKVGSEVKFVWASEETGFTHLYTIAARLSGPQITVPVVYERAEGVPHARTIGPGGPSVSIDVSNESMMNSPAIQSGFTKSLLLEKVQLTSGNWEVSSKDVWVDDERRLIYFVGLKEIPLERHLYVTCLNPSDSRTNCLRRLTDSGFSHTYIGFDTQNFKYFVNIQSNITIPPFGYINKIIERVPQSTVDNSSPKRRNFQESPRSESLPRFTKLGLIVCNPFISSVDMNPSSSSSSLSMINEQSDLLPGLPKPELFTYQLKGSGDLIYGVIFKPEFMENGVKYPCLLDIYGGPEVQTVSNSFKGVRQVRRHLLASEGYVVCAFDCRGSHHRGKSFEGHIYKRMGQVEIEEQVEVLEWLAENTGYIDMKRVAIHGWSYGGYLSLMALAQRPDIFKLSIAGAPVCKWSLYDTGYTERYMDTPFNNPEGFTKGNVLNYIHQFPDEENRLLIIHGLMDENVHFKHSLEVINALIKAGKPYQLQVIIGSLVMFFFANFPLLFRCIHMNDIHFVTAHVASTMKPIYFHTFNNIYSKLKVCTNLYITRMIRVVSCN